MSPPTSRGGSVGGERDALLARIRLLSREEKLALFAEGVEKTRTARVTSANRPTNDGSKVIRLRLSNGRILAYRLGPDDLAL